MPNYLKEEKKLQILHLLVEGNSCRSVSRLTGCHLVTILKYLVEAGEHCEYVLDICLRNLKLEHIQCDEIWTFTTKKDRVLTDAEKDNPELGSQYLFMAMDSKTKLIASHLIGKRTRENTEAFMADLYDRLVLPTSHEAMLDPDNRPQMSTDAFGPYLNAVDWIFQRKVKYGQVVKSYDGSQQQERRYAPARLSRVQRRDQWGVADETTISTSHIERCNLSVRTFMRRFTRLALGFSKKLDNLKAATSLFIAHYNFCRIHGTLKRTPALAAGVTDRKWSLADLMAA